MSTPVALPPQPKLTLTPGLEPSNATDAPGSKGKTKTHNSLFNTAGVIAGLAQKNHDTRDLADKMKKSFKDGEYTQKECESNTGMSFTDAAWEGLGGSLMTTNEAGEKVFTSKAHYEQAWLAQKDFCETTRISLSQYCHAEKVTLVNSTEFTAWLSNLSEYALSQMAENPVLRDAFKRIVERGARVDIPKYDKNDPDIFYDALIEGMTTLRDNADRPEWWTMIGQVMLTEFSSVSVENKIYPEEMGLNDPQNAREFLRDVFQPALQGGSFVLTKAQVSQIKTFKEQVAKLRDIVGDQTESLPPVYVPLKTSKGDREVGGRAVTLNDLDLDFSIEITGKNSKELKEFDVDGNGKFDFQDIAQMLDNGAEPATILAALAACPVYDTTRSHTPRPVDLASVPGAPGEAPSPIGPHAQPTHPVEPGTPPLAATHPDVDIEPTHPISAYTRVDLMDTDLPAPPAMLVGFRPAF